MKRDGETRATRFGLKVLWHKKTLLRRIAGKSSVILKWESRSRTPVCFYAKTNKGKHEIPNIFHHPWLFKSDNLINKQPFCRRIQYKKVYFYRTIFCQSIDLPSNVIKLFDCVISIKMRSITLLFESSNSFEKLKYTYIQEMTCKVLSLVTEEHKTFSNRVGTEANHVSSK